GRAASGPRRRGGGQPASRTRDRLALQFGLYCIEFFEQFRERTGYPIDFRQNGSLRIALTKTYRADLQARLQAAREFGLEAELLSPGQVAERVPLLRLPDDCAILFIPRDGFVEPKSVAVAYAAAAR